MKHVNFCVTVLDCHPLLLSFQLMLLEHIILCRLIMGNKTMAIQEVHARGSQCNLQHSRISQTGSVQNRANVVLISAWLSSSCLGPTPKWHYAVVNCLATVTAKCILGASCPNRHIMMCSSFRHLWPRSFSYCWCFYWSKAINAERIGQSDALYFGRLYFNGDFQHQQWKG